MKKNPSRPRLLRAAVNATLAVALSACAAQPRIVALGDVHGDLEATRSALRLAGAIDDDDRWIGGRLVVVQTGDQLDRGDDEQEILDLFDRLRKDAADAGGAFHALLGNHELMNVRGDFRYVTDGGYEDFEGAVEFDPADPALGELEPRQRARMAAFRPGAPYALLMSDRSVILQLGDNVFVHGGVLPDHVTYGIDRINQDAQRWLRGELERPPVLTGPDSPQWTRLFSRDPDEVACETLQGVLDRMDAKRLIMGHTIQDDGIASACGGQAWRIDVGMAAHYGGPTEVLEIVGDSVRVLRVAGAAGRDGSGS